MAMGREGEMNLGGREGSGLGMKPFPLLSRI